MRRHLPQPARGRPRPSPPGARARPDRRRVGCARAQAQRLERRDAEALLQAHPSLGRYLTRRRGHFVVDQQKMNVEERVDGNFLLSSSDDSLAAAEIALGYKPLIEVERGWRTLKHTPDPPPVYHRKDQRIRAHVLLCFLALLLTRAIEVETGKTWPTVRRELERMDRFPHRVL